MKDVFVNFLVGMGLGNAAGRASASAVSRAPWAVAVVLALMEVAFAVLSMQAGAEGSGSLLSVAAMAVGLVLAVATGLAVVGSGHGAGGIIGGFFLAASAFCAALVPSMLSTEAVVFALMLVAVVRTARKG